MYYSAFECAVCRCIFSNFTEFELHENDCNTGTNDAQATSHTEGNELILEHITSTHPDDVFVTMKFESQLDTQEIIVETSH